MVTGGGYKVTLVPTRVVAMTSGLGVVKTCEPCANKQWRLIWSLLE